MMRYLRRHRLFELEHDVDEDDEPEAALCASAVSGREPPAGPQWLRGLSPPLPSALAYDKPLCASLDGFTLHAATRAGAHHAAAREALLRYVLRPPIAQERVELQQDGLVRLSLKRAFADGTVAVDMDPLSLLCRLAASVPPPRFHTVKYAGVLASASPWRMRIGPQPAKPEEPAKANDEPAPKRKRGGYRPWAELLRRTFALDVLECPACKGGMKLVAMVTEPRSIARFLSALGEPTDVARRPPLTQPGTAVLEEHRPAPQGARGRRVAARTSRVRPTPAGRRVPAPRRCAHWRALRRPGPALSSHERGVTTLAAPPLRFAAPLFLAERSGLFFLRAAKNTRGDVSARLHRLIC
jgi:hypothetical protein